jgi:hypothetical protein
VERNDGRGAWARDACQLQQLPGGALFRSWKAAMLQPQSTSQPLGTSNPQRGPGTLHQVWVRCKWNTDLHSTPNHTPTQQFDSAKQGCGIGFGKGKKLTVAKVQKRKSSQPSTCTPHACSCHEAARASASLRGAPMASLSAAICLAGHRDRLHVPLLLPNGTHAAAAAAALDPASSRDGGRRVGCACRQCPGWSRVRHTSGCCCCCCSSHH